MVINLTQGYKATIDDENEIAIGQHKWFALKSGKNIYAARHTPGNHKKFILMHRVIMCATDTCLVDHINHNTLDNRKENLRLCSSSQNMMNKNSNRGISQYKGAHWHKINKKWVAGIRYFGKQLYLGSYSMEEDAARAYDAKAIELFGEFALLNFKED
jgi:hypothetical protein